MALVKLAEGGFTLMRAGRQTLLITKAEGKPSGNPQLIECSFKNQYGETVNNNYTLDPSNEKGLQVTTIFLKACLGDITEFDTADIPSLVGKALDVEIVHNVKDSTKKEGETVTFANIGKILGGAEGFDLPQASSPSARPRL